MDSVYLVSTGMVCCVGLTAAAACAAMRAGITMFQELPYLDNRGEPIVGAFVPGLDPRLSRGGHLIEMLAIALRDCLSTRLEPRMEEVPLLVGLAEPGRPGGCADLAQSVIESLEDKLRIKFHPRHSQGVAKGHTAGFECLRIARELFSQDEVVPGCLVCGVDSYINAMTLLWLDKHWRLKRGEHSDGVIPGEAAAAVYLQRIPPVKQRPVEAVGLGFGFEQAGILTDEPLRGIGLANAATEALADANLRMHEVDFRISDVAGESYGFKEQSCALQHLLRESRGSFPIWHNADSIGDTGAAAGVCELVTVFHSFQVGYAPGRRVICYCSAVPGCRAVAILQA